MQMFVGLREHLDPTITAAATLMIILTLSILLLIVARRLAEPAPLTGPRAPCFWALVD